MTDNPLTDNKTLTVQIRVSAEELAIITALAAKSFMKPGPFMRHLALMTAAAQDAQNGVKTPQNTAIASEVVSE